MNRTRTLFAVVILLSMAAGYFLRHEPQVDEQAVLRTFVPGDAFGEKAGAPPHYRSRGGRAAFSSSDVTPGIRGYAGPLNVLVVIGPDSRIRGIKLLSHRETKTYV